ncbi:MAG: hypothetical protein LHW56_01495 [Candidatus Cloacimonetes bacterium]|nr:hypothetical protein [Candidatus Cloacimonadota bacterium]MDY0171561.1 hypothetical protein [Candidatus Cloacimonadaceae bacterium]
MDWYNVGMEKVAFLGAGRAFVSSAIRGVKALPRVAKNLRVPTNKMSPWQYAQQAATTQQGFRNKASTFYRSLKDSAVRGLGRDQVQGLRNLGRAGKYTAYTGGGLYLGNKAFGSKRKDAEQAQQYLAAYLPQAYPRYFQS